MVNGTMTANGGKTILAITDINRVFGIDIKPEILKPINTNVSVSDLSAREDFLEILPLTRNIRVPDPDIGGGRISFTAKLAVGFPILERNETVQRLAFRCDIIPGNVSHVFEREFSDSFWQRENMDFMPIVEKILFKTNNSALLKRRALGFKSTLSVASVLSPLQRQQRLTDKEVSVLSDFLNTHSVTYSNSGNETAKIKGLKVSPPVKICSGYLPNIWTLKDLAAWVLVTDRWPTLSEARKLQRENQIKMNRLMADLETERT